MKTQRGNRGTAVLFNHGVRWGWVVNATPWLLFPQKRDPVPLEQEAR